MKAPALAVVSITCVLLSGCESPSHNVRTGDPAALVRGLIEHNGLKKPPFSDRVPLPRRGQDWDHLMLAYFPGGVAVSWWGGMEAKNPLLFRSDGTFMACVMQYSSAVPLTRQGTRDLITAEYGGAGICIMLRPLEPRGSEPVQLASMIKYAYSATMFPRLWDADQDGVFEIVCCLQAGAVNVIATAETRIPGADPREPVLVVWSVQNGVPRVVLALGECCEFQGLDEWASELFVQGKEIKWDETTGRFLVPKLEGIPVLVNRGLKSNHESQ